MRETKTAFHRNSAEGGRQEANIEKLNLVANLLSETNQTLTRELPDQVRLIPQADIVAAEPEALLTHTLAAV